MSVRHLWTEPAPVKPVKPVPQLPSNTPNNELLAVVKQHYPNVSGVLALLVERFDELLNEKPEPRTLVDVFANCPHCGSSIEGEAKA